MSKKRASREEVLRAIQKTIRPTKVEGNKRRRLLATRTFLAKSGLRRCDVYSQFPSWNEALKEAGFDLARESGPYIEQEHLLADWGMVARKLQRLPSNPLYDFNGKYSSRTLQVRFGSWNDVPAAFREFAKRKEEWADVVKLVEKGRDEAGGRKYDRTSCMAASGQVREDRPVFGEPLGPPGLLNAPTNENGVILVFGSLAAQLGFHIQSVQTAFPDCNALRKMGNAGWQNVRIEFEFQSRNFHEHGHPPNGCDIIVCWEHNWKDCPASLEVIALRDVVQQLSGVVSG